VLAAQPQGGLDCGGWLYGGVRGAMIGGFQALGAATAKPGHESTDGRAGEPE
jgi:hypothetical protein